MDDILKKEIQFLKGVGPKRAEAFESLGIKTLMDLVNYYPRTYEDRSVIKTIKEIIPGEKATVQCTVANVESRRIRKGLSILKAVLFDETGYMNVVWFNQDYYYKKLKEGEKFWFYGKMERKILPEMINPIFSDIFEEFAIIVPVYRKNKELTQNIFRKSIKAAFNEKGMRFKEIFPDWVLNDYSLISFDRAVKNIHYPDNNEAFYESRKRLVFQEFLLLQISLLLLKNEYCNENIEGNLYTKFDYGNIYLNGLGFELTGAQKRVMKEIRADFKSRKSMHRLVQGDVGSGKTAVAAAAIVDTCENGYQAAFMAPTEILAKQHYENLKVDFENLGLSVVYLGGDLKAAKKRNVNSLIENGKADVIIGTHALIQKAVNFKNLGLVITDEQHRFGVNQRKSLTEKGNTPHSLVLTATPIPRTLALILYGDLDISIIDEMPPGRKSIETYSIGPDKRRRALDFAKKRMDSGAQVYYVCPRIEEEGESDLMSAETVYKELSNFYGGYKVELIHGRIKTQEKNRIMSEFYKGDIHLLVSTTVIEVGVNVPNATLMVIENAERFGLAQLHQLRGRVGRGMEQSYCVMINRGIGEVAKKRMEIMSSSTDGFFISEQDLEIRGPGEFFGTRQHGLPEFKIANIYSDMDLLKNAQEAAVRLLKEDPDLLSPANANIMVETKRLMLGYTAG